MKARRRPSPAAGRFAGSHQALKRRRRWLLQRHFRASIRESQSADQLRGIAADFGARRGLDQLLWAHDRFRTSGMDPSRGHGDPVRPRRRRHLRVGSTTATLRLPILSQFQPNRLGKRAPRRRHGRQEVRFGIADFRAFVECLDRCRSEGETPTIFGRPRIPLSGGYLLCTRHEWSTQQSWASPGSGQDRHGRRS